MSWKYPMDWNYPKEQKPRYKDQSHCRACKINYPKDCLRCSKCGRILSKRRKGTVEYQKRRTIQQLVWCRKNRKGEV